MHDDTASLASTNVASNEPQSSNAPVKSVAEMTFGAVPVLERQIDLRDMRRVFEEEMVAAAMGFSRPDGPEEY